MSAFPCPNPHNLCPDPSAPIQNLSSEAPDEFVYIGRYWPPNEPPLDSGGPWTSTYCGQTCESTISQEDADQIVGAQLEVMALHGRRDLVVGLGDKVL